MKIIILDREIVADYGEAWQIVQDLSATLVVSVYTGSDANLPAWKNLDLIQALTAEIVIMGRPGHPNEQEEFRTLTIQRVDLSSSKVRERTGQPNAYAMPLISKTFKKYTFREHDVEQTGYAFPGSELAVPKNPRM